MAAALEAHGGFETVRRALREWTGDDADRILSWGPEQEVDAAACFPELLRWVQAWWTPCGEAADPASLVLALDPTHHRDEWVALVVSVAYRQHALPVAWHVVGAQARESWRAHFGRLLRQMAPLGPGLADPGAGPRLGRWPARSLVLRRLKWSPPFHNPGPPRPRPRAARIPGPNPAYRSGHRVRVATDAHHELPNSPEHPDRTGTCT